MEPECLPDDDPTEDLLDELTTILVDVLGPALAWHRAETARRLEIDAPSLATLELARHHRTVSHALVGERTGLTRSAVSKMMRRLEADGHLDRLDPLDPRRRQAGQVVLRPHPGRDAGVTDIRAQLRRRIGNRLGPLVRSPDLPRALAIVRDLAEALHTVTRDAVDERAEQRRSAVREVRLARRGW